MALVCFLFCYFFANALNICSVGSAKHFSEEMFSVGTSPGREDNLVLFPF